MPQLLPVRVEGHRVFIGDVELPNWIEEDGVVFKPGGNRDINRLTVTFLVGEFHADDATRESSGT